MMGELLDGHKVLQILVVRQNKYHMCQSVQVVAPLFEGLEYGQDILVIDLVVEVSRLHAM